MLDAVAATTDGNPSSSLRSVGFAGVAMPFVLGKMTAIIAAVVSGISARAPRLRDDPGYPNVASPGILTRRAQPTYRNEGTVRLSGVRDRVVAAPPLWAHS